MKTKRRRTHKILIFSLCLIGLGVGKLAVTHTPSTVITPVITPVITQTVSGCDSSLWNHIYHPARLQVIENCKTVTGTVEVIRLEKDGDEHILVKLDPQFSGLVNQVNVDKQHGDLVIEPVCENPVTQADAIDSCTGFSQNFHIVVGEHIEIMGAYVTDLQHGWNEIHPITQVTKI